MDKHWEDDDFAAVKVDMHNAFNLASRHMNALFISLSFYPGSHGAMLLILCCGTPWVTWCYAAHPLLWHPMGHMVLCCSSLAVAPHGSHGAMLLIPCCGTPWVTSPQKQVSNKVNP